MRVEEARRRGGRVAPKVGLRLFDVLLGIGNLALLFVAVLTVLYAGSALAGSDSGTVTLDAEVDPPYTVELGDGSAVETGSGPTAWIDFPVGEEHRYLADEPTVRARVKVGPDDTDARLVLAAGLGAWLALAWWGLVNVRRVVRSALDGRPFDARNVDRLRWLAVVVFAVPLAIRLELWALEPRLDVEPPVDLLTPGPSSWVFVLLGTGLLALAEIFREGSRLRSLEEATT